MLRKLIMQHKQIIAYLIVGGLTTLVNWAVHFPLYKTGTPAALSSGIAWLAAVLFAFPTNKLFVYTSKCWHFRVTVPEFFSFVSCRLLSGLLEAGMLFVFVDLLQWNGIVWKIMVSVIVVCINYITGKILVFRKKE